MSRIRKTAIVLLLTAAAAANSGCDYDCQVYMHRPSDRHYDPNVGDFVDGPGQFMGNYNVDASGVSDAKGKAIWLTDLPDLRNQPSGSQYVAYCREKGKTDVQYVTYNWASDSRKGVNAIYWRPVTTPRAILITRKPQAGSPAQPQPTAPSVSQLPFTISVVGSLEIANSDFSFSPGFYGGVRLDRPINPQVRVFGELLAGITHFSGENDFTWTPSGGVIIPLQAKPFSIVASVGFPNISFSGFHETGFRFSGGLTFPFSR